MTLHSQSPSDPHFYHAMLYFVHLKPVDGYPKPVVHIEHIQDCGEIVKWELSDCLDMNYRLTSFAVNVIAERI